MKTYFRCQHFYMCGIAGFFSPGNSVQDGVIQTMTHCIAHRGPDSEDFYSDELVSFGHRRLSIIDLSSAANQPMTSQDGNWIMMFNGEVFNFREVARSLKVSLRTHSDTEVMLEAFAANGPSAVGLFNGMFTIALYHKPEKTLYLFRDRMGVKPLFYYRNGNDWFFASEIKSLVSADSIRKHLTVSNESISQYLQSGYISEPHTIWNQIKKFPAGHYAKIELNKSSFECYWKAEEKISFSVIADLSTAKNTLRDLLESSVTYRMISDVPFGIFLSGGIDSSLIAVIASQQSKIKTFTIGFKEEKYNEAPYARKIAEYLKTDHYECTLSYQDALDLIDQSMDAYDEPFADSSAIPTMLVSKFACEHVKMVLSGDGGDELFMGYGMYRWAKRLDKPLIKSLKIPIALSLSQMGNRYRRAASVFRFEEEKNLPAHIFSQEQYFFSGAETKKMMGAKYVDPGFQFPDSSTRKISAAEKQALYDLTHYLKDDLLVKVDRATMQYSIECRTPFLDYRIVEFALNVSEKLKMRNGELKILPRLLLQDFLPAELFERPKWGFAVPLRHWLKNELRHLADTYLSDEMIRSHSLVDHMKVNSLKKKFFEGRDYLYNRLWNLIVLHRWLQKYH